VKKTANFRRFFALLQNFNKPFANPLRNLDNFLKTPCYNIATNKTTRRLKK